MKTFHTNNIVNKKHLQSYWHFLEGQKPEEKNSNTEVVELKPAKF